ncbi:hypothetical protein [Vibrio alginolyticus]|uniref:hypothetical protein n=1 Tax=Vibrio alginolyticus TaxID=663 RepID=UPI003D7E66F8
MFVFIFLFLAFYIVLFYKTKNILLTLPIFYSLTVVYSYLGIKVFSFGIEVPFDLYNAFPEKEWDVSLTAYLLSSAFFTTGLLFSGIQEPESSSIEYNTSKKYSKVGAILVDKSDWGKIFLLILTILFLISGYGLENLLSREGYVPHEGRNKLLLIFYMMFLPLSSFSLAFLKSRYLRVFGYSILFLLVFGTTARMLLLLPAIYYLGICIKFGRLKIKYGLFTFFVLLFIITYTLEYRNLPIQGIIPNLKYMMANGVSVDYIILGLNYILSYSFASNSYSIYSFSFDFNSFLIAINPMPSSMLDISYMLDKMSMNANSPIPTIGYLFLSGFFVGSLYYFFAGFIFNKVFRYAKRNNTILYMVILALFCLFVLLSGQYNLRGSTRLIYYCVFVTLLYRSYRILKYNIKINL